MRPFRLVPVLVLPLALLLPTGCGVSSSGTGPAPNLHAQGAVFGGQQPVSGATLQLYAVGTAGDGSPASPQLTQSVTSGADGSFNITGLYPCVPGTLLYLTATGGSPTNTAGVTGPVNPDLAMLTVLGPCDQVKVMPFITVNEVTTVAGVNALAPFMSSLTSVGSYTSDAASLQAAFTLASELANPATGASPGLNVPSGYTAPTAEIYTLANIVAACINTYGGTAGDASPCGQLFTYTDPEGVAPATNTVQALLDLALNPTFNTTALFQLSAPVAPFQPQLTAAPANFSIALVPASPLQISPYGLVFPPTTSSYGTASLGVTLTNVGAATLSISSIAISGINAGDFRILGSCPSLAAQATCSLAVYFSPVTYGNRNASLVVTSSGSALPTSIPLLGVGSNGGSTLFAAPANLSFLDGQAGVPTGPQTVTLINASAAAVTLNSFTFAGGVPTDFSQTNTCPAILAAGSACTINVVDTPATITSTQTATLNIANSTPASPLAISLTEMPGTLGPVNLTDTTVTAATVAVFDGGTVKLTNQGSLPLLISSITVSQGFAETDTCPASLAAGASCTVTFAATYYGSASYNGILTVSDNAPSSPQTAPIFTHFSSANYPPYHFFYEDLEPFGSAVVNTVSPVVYNYKVQVPGPPTYIQTFGGPNQSDFAGGFTSCQYSGEYSSCNVQFSFGPSGLGPRNAFVTLRGNSTIALTGFGVAAGPVATFLPNLTSGDSISPPTTGFLSVPQNSSAAISGTVYNTGTTALNFTGATITFTGPNASEFTLGSTTCASLALAASCPLTLNFAPLGVGPRNASMNVADSVSGTTIQIPLSFLAAVPPPVVSVTQLTFAAHINQTVSQTFTVSSVGVTAGHALTISTPAAPYALYPSTCPANTASCLITVLYTPTADSLYPDLATVSVSDATSGLSSTVSLAGSAGIPLPTPSPSPLAFGTVADNSTTLLMITLQNNGDGLMFIKTNPTITGPNMADFTCGSAIDQQADPGVSDFVYITFKPSASGPRTATLHIYTTDTVGNVTTTDVPLSGTAP